MDNPGPGRPPNPGGPQPFPDPARPWTELVVEFHANPLETRSVKELVQELGLSEDAYYKFMAVNREAVYIEADKRRKKYISAMRAKAYRALVQRFSRSDKALQMFFEMSGDYIPKSEQKIEYLTPEQKREKIKNLINDALKGSNSE